MQAKRLEALYQALKAAMPSQQIQKSVPGGVVFHIELAAQRVDGGQPHPRRIKIRQHFQPDVVFQAIQRFFASAHEISFAFPAETIAFLPENTNDQR